MQQQLAPNTLLHGGTYKIEKVLGQGSFGITYLAEHTSLGRKLAIKEFFMKEFNTRKEDGCISALSQGTLSYSYAQKFRKEAMNMARMEHPNIVRVTDSFEDNGTFYYVMDYIEGQNLNDFIKKYPMSVDRASSTIKQVAEALIYMHDTMHMLHLDLKPGNIMRRKGDGHIFLIDFGLSKHFDANGAPETSTTIGLGTAGYAPIEQANQAKSGEFRPTIDVYALGATFFKLLTGKTPPDASYIVSDDEILVNELNAAGIPQTISNVVIHAMMPNVRKRTATITDFYEEIMSATTKTKRKNKASKSEINNPTDNEETVIYTPKATEKKDSTPESEETILATPITKVASYRSKQPMDFYTARKAFVVEGFDKQQTLKKLIISGLSPEDAEKVLAELADNTVLRDTALYLLTEIGADRSATMEILTRIGHPENDAENCVAQILTELWDKEKRKENIAILLGLVLIGGGIFTAFIGGSFLRFTFIGILSGIIVFCIAAWKRMHM